MNERGIAIQLEEAGLAVLYMEAGAGSVESLLLELLKRLDVPSVTWIQNRRTPLNCEICRLDAKMGSQFRCKGWKLNCLYGVCRHVSKIEIGRTKNREIKATEAHSVGATI